MHLSKKVGEKGDVAFPFQDSDVHDNPGVQ